MDFHNLSDEEKRKLIDHYIYQKDQEKHANQIAQIGSGFVIMMLIVVGGAGSLIFKGELGTTIAKFCFGGAVIIFVLSQIGKWLSGHDFSDPLK